MEQTGLRRTCVNSRDLSPGIDLQIPSRLLIICETLSGLGGELHARRWVLADFFNSHTIASSAAEAGALVD